MTFYIQTYPYRRMERMNRSSQLRTLGVNLIEQDDAYQLYALVPGLKAEDLNIEVLGDLVSVQGEYPAAEGRYLLNEIPGGSFQRTLRLPVEIQADKVEAKITDGVLSLTLPKAESAKPKKISISVN